jgi:transposase
VKTGDGFLTKAERQALEAQLGQTHDAALYRRTLAVLEVDRGRSVAEVAQQLRVDRRSVYRWLERFATQDNPAGLEHQPGQGRPLEWNDELAGLAESALEQPPFQLGYPANSWNMPLLHAFLGYCLPEYPVSLSTVRRHVAEMGIQWKRFRHALPPDPEAEKKTPDPASDSGLASTHGPAGAG